MASCGVAGISSPPPTPPSVISVSPGPNPWDHSPAGAKSLGISRSLRAPISGSRPHPRHSSEKLFLYLDAATKKASEVWFGNLFDNGFARVRLRGNVF